MRLYFSWMSILVSSKLLTTHSFGHLSRQRFKKTNKIYRNYKKNKRLVVDIYMYLYVCMYMYISIFLSL